MDRYAADRMVKRLARRPGIVKRISPPLRPSTLGWPFVTFRGGPPRRPRTTMCCDRGRGSLDRLALVTLAAAGSTGDFWPRAVLRDRHQPAVRDGIPLPQPHLRAAVQEHAFDQNWAIVGNDDLETPVRRRSLRLVTFPIGG